MKNLLLATLSILLITMVSAHLGEESMYEGPVVSYSVEKGTGEVLITLNLDNPSQFEQIKVVRSDNPVKYFRQVKLLQGEVVNGLSGSDVIIDKYPLPGSKNSFYKVVTTDRSGVQKTYPSVKLAKF